MPSDEEFEDLRNRIGSLEGQASTYRRRWAPSAEQLQDYVKVREALTHDPVDLAESEIRNFHRVREYILAAIYKGPIGTCGMGSDDPHGDDPDAVTRFGNLG